MTRKYGTAEGHSPWFGIELEAEYSDDGAYAVDVGNNIAVRYDGPRGRQVIFVHDDGSLYNGAEFVTSPFSRKMWREGKSKTWGAFAPLVQELASGGWKSHDTSTCGLHIHISRSALTEKKWETFAFIWDALEDVVKLVARRGAMSWCNKLPVGADGRPRKVTDDRYYEINFINSNTVEIRRFRGTLYVPAINAALALVDTVVWMADNNYPATPMALFNAIQTLDHGERLAKYIGERAARKGTTANVWSALRSFFPEYVATQDENGGV